MPSIQRPFVSLGNEENRWSRGLSIYINCQHLYAIFRRDAPPTLRIFLTRESNRWHLLSYLARAIQLTPLCNGVKDQTWLKLELPGKNRTSISTATQFLFTCIGLMTSKGNILRQFLWRDGCASNGRGLSHAIWATSATPTLNLVNGRQALDSLDLHASTIFYL